MKIRNLDLRTADLDGLYNFYIKRMKFPLIWYDETYFTLAAGYTTLTFREDDVPGREPFYHFAFNIPENRFHEAKAFVEEVTELLPFEGNTTIDFPDWEAHAMYFLDPAGNIVEFIARHCLGNAVSGAFKPTIIQSISEIGLPIEDLPSFYTYLNEEIGVPFFYRTPPGDTFAPLGDDNGLFITTPTDRQWFPTDTRSQRFPLAVTALCRNLNQTLELYDYTITLKPDPHTL